MNKSYIKDILNSFSEKNISLEKAVEQISECSYKDMGYAKIDHNRNIRKGFPEVIFCERKTTEMIVAICREMAEKGSDILGTRVNPEVFAEVKKIAPGFKYNEAGRIFYLQKNEKKQKKGIVLICAGTSDIPVAEEALETARIMGNDVVKLYDIGVAGIHRLFENIDVIRSANVIIAIAGMEGALPSVVSGLVSCPVIAVPTSVGYGTSFGGISALLGMLNSCSSGITVVNIDNGFGAGYAAALINKKCV